MTISRQNLSIIIVTFKSENVIHDCIKSIPSDIMDNRQLRILFYLKDYFLDLTGDTNV